MIDRAAAFRRDYERGMDLLAAGKDDEAMSIMFRAAKAAPEGWLAVACQLIKDGRQDLALQRLREVLTLSNNAKVRAAALNNIGMILANGGRNDSAHEAFTESAALWPDCPDTHSNMGLIAQWRADYAGALKHLDTALALDPWHEQASFCRAMVLLLSGDYARGWDAYECRWRSRHNNLAKIATPVLEWDGRETDSLLIYGEQGQGDFLLSLRFAKQCQTRCRNQYWVTQRGMAPLAAMMPNIQVIQVGDTLPEFTAHLPCMSLPRVLGVQYDDLRGSSYLPRPTPVDYGPGYHVGICWRGSHAQGNDVFRSTHLSEWGPALEVPGVTYHSLAVEFADEALLYPQIVREAPPRDWLETAQRVAGMDLVITVDTGVAHLAGAMGIPCWVAMHCRPYFVYPPSAGDCTPWYKSLRLFRQARELQWGQVFECIAKSLHEKIQSHL